MKPDPFEQFFTWYSEAERLSPKNPNAMALATCTKDGKPSVRVVLYKGMQDDGLVFFTNYESRKSKEIQENPWAAAVFYWPNLDRQVRIEGRIEKLGTDDSADYFRTRPRESQISAWASPQSREIPSREFLDERAKDIREKFEAGEVPLPPFWGGYRLVPENFEFWMEQPDRRHDRYSYRLKNNNTWTMIRLAP